MVRAVRVEGNRYTRETVILSALKSQVGRVFTRENARQDLRRVLRLGAFTEVVFGTEEVADGIVLVVRVEEASPYIPSLSFAITQENGLEVGPAFSSSNLLGMAARASAYFRFGGATNLGLRYTNPQLPRVGLLSGLSFEYFHRERTNELLDFQEKTDEFFLELKQSTSDEMKVGLRLRWLSLRADRAGVTLDGDGSDVLPSAGLFLRSDSRNGLYPTGGALLDLEAARYGILGGDGEYWRLDLEVRNYFALPWIGERHSVALSTYASLVNGVIGETVPPHQEFYIGGTNSVRGWSLGSRQGRNQWLGTAEYWYRLMEQKEWRFWFLKWRMGFQAALLGDFGTAWSTPEGLERSMIGGGGVGFRLTLPVVTTVRFDLAWGEEGAGLRFFIGGGEQADAERLRVR